MVPIHRVDRLIPGALVAAAMLGGCGSEATRFGEALVESRERLDDFACTCELDLGACNAELDDEAAACFTAAHASADPKARAALDCILSQQIELIDCYEDINRCEPTALEVCHAGQSTCAIEDLGHELTSELERCRS